jgi:hypothetical protein
MKEQKMKLLKVLNELKSLGSSPGRGWEFFSSPPRPDQLWGPPNLLFTGYQELFPQG